MYLCGIKTSSNNLTASSATQTAWGTYSLVEAERILIMEALSDPFNQRFQMVCEATIPVQPPLFTHALLLAGALCATWQAGPIPREGGAHLAASRVYSLQSFITLHTLLQRDG